MHKYLKILRDIRANKQLTLDDLKFFAKFTQEVDKKTLEKLKTTEEFKDLSDREIEDALQAAFVAAVQDPAYKEQVLSLAEETAKGELSEKIGVALNLALAGTDIGASVAQIQASNRELAQLTPPQRPAPLTKDPRLQRALSDAERGNYDSIRALLPAQRAILDNYLSDLNMARTVSGGQTGAYGALGQVASIRRGKAAQELAPIYDQFRRADQARYDQLLGQSIAENQAIQQSQAQYYPTDVYQYNRNLQAAAELGQVGRQNLRSSATGFASQLPGLISELSTRRRFRDIYNSMNSAYDSDAAKTAAMADYELKKLYDQPSSYYQNQYEQAYGLLG